jgi:hypothetical protein
MLLVAAPSNARGHEELCSPRADVVFVPPPDDDWDCDFVKDDVDNCPPIGYDNLATRNPNQADSDGNGVGDACQADDDADGVPDWTDGRIDYESTRVKRDNCRVVPNPDQLDTNGNGIGNACEFDTDGDGVFDSEDNCERVPNPDQADLDGDRAGDACDNDVDGDYVRDSADNCPRFPNPYDPATGKQADADGDGIGDACDTPDPVPTPTATFAPPPPAATPPPAVDRQAPRVTVRVPSTVRAAEVQDGLIVRVRCSEACTVRAELRADARAARALKATVVARGTARVEAAATTYAFVRFDRKIRTKLLRRPRSTLKLRVTATDPAGNTRRVTETLTLRR